MTSKSISGFQYLVVIVIVAGGCSKAPSPPPQRIGAWIESWAKMGMYLPGEEQVAVLKANLKDVAPELAAAVSHKNSAVRQRAAYVIGKIGPDARSLGPALVERLKVEPERLVRIYLVSALAGIKDNDPSAMELLKSQFESLGSENVPRQENEYAEVDEKINVASALYVLTSGTERRRYLDFVLRWLIPPNPGMTPLETASYWERRWMAVIALEQMRDAQQAISLLEAMLEEKGSPGWVSVHVPRVLGVLKGSGADREWRI